MECHDLMEKFHSCCIREYRVQNKPVHQVGSESYPYISAKFIASVKLKETLSAIYLITYLIGEILTGVKPGVKFPTKSRRSFESLRKNKTKHQMDETGHKNTQALKDQAKPKYQ